MKNYKSILSLCKLTEVCGKVKARRAPLLAEQPTCFLLLHKLIWEETWINVRNPKAQTQTWIYKLTRTKTNPANKQESTYTLSNYSSVTNFVFYLKPELQNRRALQLDLVLSICISSGRCWCRGRDPEQRACFQLGKWNERVLTRPF